MFLLDVSCETLFARFSVIMFHVKHFQEWLTDAGTMFHVKHKSMCDQNESKVFHVKHKKM